MKNMAKEPEWSGLIGCLSGCLIGCGNDPRHMIRLLKFGLAAIVLLFCSCSDNEPRESNMEVISVEEFGDLYGGITNDLNDDFHGLHLERDDFGNTIYYGVFDRGLVRQGPHLLYHDTGGLAQSAHLSLIHI